MSIGWNLLSLFELFSTLSSTLSSLGGPALFLLFSALSVSISPVFFSFSPACWCRFNQRRRIEFWHRYGRSLHDVRRFCVCRRLLGRLNVWKLSIWRLNVWSLDTWRLLAWRLDGALIGGHVEGIFVIEKVLFIIILQTTWAVRDPLVIVRKAHVDVLPCPLSFARPRLGHAYDVHTLVTPKVAHLSVQTVQIKMLSSNNRISFFRKPDRSSEVKEMLVEFFFVGLFKLSEKCLRNHNLVREKLLLRDRAIFP
mmetsp:Transcript_5773/g.11429  ORF Transcript_5773/g.11429 Transcript_5773/m.11429 type:complete len:253 (-) Transcript_5773:424-1182(-)